MNTKKRIAACAIGSLGDLNIFIQTILAIYSKIDSIEIVLFGPQDEEIIHEAERHGITYIPFDYHFRQSFLQDFVALSPGQLAGAFGDPRNWEYYTPFLRKCLEYPELFEGVIIANHLTMFALVGSGLVKPEQIILLDAYFHVGDQQVRHIVPSLTPQFSWFSRQLHPIFGKLFNDKLMEEARKLGVSLGLVPNQTHLLDVVEQLLLKLYTLRFDEQIVTYGNSHFVPRIATSTGHPLSEHDLEFLRRHQSIGVFGFTFGSMRHGRDEIVARAIKYVADQGVPVFCTTGVHLPYQHDFVHVADGYVLYDELAEYIRYMIHSGSSGNTAYWLRAGVPAGAIVTLSEQLATVKMARLHWRSINRLNNGKMWSLINAVRRLELEPIVLVQEPQITIADLIIPHLS